MAAGKLIRHSCGYLLRIASMGFVGDEAVVVIYREATRFSLPLYHCPRCGQALRLWWDVPPTEVEAHRQRRQRLYEQWVKEEKGARDGWT